MIEFVGREENFFQVNAESDEQITVFISSQTERYAF